MPVFLAALPWIATAAAGTAGGAALMSYFGSGDSETNKQNDGLVVIENNVMPAPQKRGPDLLLLGTVAAGALLAAGLATGKVKVKL